MIGYLDGRAYYRLDAWYALHSQLPGWDVLRPTVGAVAGARKHTIRSRANARPPCHRRLTRTVTAPDMGHRSLSTPAATVLVVVG